MTYFFKYLSSRATYLHCGKLPYIQFRDYFLCNKQNFVRYFSLLTISKRTITDLTEILIKVREGDEKAFRQLFDIYYTEMLTTSLYILKDVNMAKDATQEAFLALWKNRAGIDTSKSIRSYIKTATINRSLNIIKSRSHHMGSGPEPLGYQISKYKTPQEISENSELKDLIKLAVDQLPDRCRTVFVLCKYEGMSYKEIAQQLNITSKTVENQMGKALKALRLSLASVVSSLLIFAFHIEAWGKSLFELYHSYVIVF